jgi:hypothetical protein
MVHIPISVLATVILKVVLVMAALPSSASVVERSP